MRKVQEKLGNVAISFVIFAGLTFIFLNFPRYSSWIIMIAFFSSILSLTACIYRLVEFKDAMCGRISIFESEGIAEILTIDQHYQRGKIYRLHGRANKAIKEFKKILSLDPYDSDVYYQLGKIYQEKGNAKEASKFLERYLELDKEKKWKEEVEEILPAIRKQAFAQKILQ